MKAFRWTLSSESFWTLQWKPFMEKFPLKASSTQQSTDFIQRNRQGLHSSFPLIAFPTDCSSFWLLSLLIASPTDCLSCCWSFLWIVFWLHVEVQRNLLNKVAQTNFGVKLELHKEFEWKRSNFGLSKQAASTDYPPWSGLAVSPVEIIFP